jgi:rubredoxin
MEQPKNWWKCSNCGYTLQAAVPPETCPSCKEKCNFVDATCYTPECGGPENIDPQIAQR